MATCKSRGGFHKADWVSVWISTVPVPEIPQDYLNLDSADQHRLADGFAREFGLTEYPWGLLEFLMEKGGQQFIKWMGPQVEPYAIGRLRMDRRTLVFSYHDEYVEKVLAAAKSLNIEQFSVLLLIYDYRYDPRVTGVEEGKYLRFVGAFRLRGDPTAKFFDRPDLLRQPEFWLLHLGGILQSPEGGSEDVPQFFGLTDKNMSRYHQSLSHHQCRGRFFPIHRIPIAIGSGFIITIEYIMAPEENEIHYLLRRADWEDAIQFAEQVDRCEPPAIAWKELVALDRAARRVSGDALPPGAPLLALYPAVWLTRGEARDEVREELISAWRCLAVAKEEMLGQMVERMIQNSHESDLEPDRKSPTGLAAILRDVLAASAPP